MRGFKRSGDGYRARISTEERAVLAAVAMDIARLLQESDPSAGRSPGPEPAGSGWSDVVLPSMTDEDPPTDPAIRRLLPDASRHDPEVAAEYRRLTQVRTDADAEALDELLNADGDSGSLRSAEADVPHSVGRDGAGANAAGAAAGEGRFVAEAGGAPIVRASESARRSLGLVHAVLGWTQASLLALVMEDRPPQPGGLRRG